MSTPAPNNPAWLKLAIDYGPLLVFFLAYRHWSPPHPQGAPPPMAGEILAITRSTGVFIAATLIALVVSKWRLGKIEPMLWVTALLVTGFGAMTVLLHDSLWIQVKPTVIYAAFAVALLVGWWRGKPLLQYLLGSAFEGLDEVGWLTLSRNWGLFFLGFAVLNEVLRWRFNATNGGFGTWLSLKLWLFTPLSVVFTFAHIPFLLRHGFDGGARDNAG